MLATFPAKWLHDGTQFQKRVVVVDNNATTNQWREQQRAGGGWCREHLREVVNDWHQKRLAARVLIVTQQHAMM
jgi:hypothetical protein